MELVERGRLLSWEMPQGRLPQQELAAGDQTHWSRDSEECTAVGQSLWSSRARDCEGDSTTGHQMIPNRWERA